MTKKLNTQVAIIGAGPGGYAAAFRAADLGFKVTLIDKNINLGGVCLNVGCIPSKALLHITKVMDEALDLKKMGVKFSEPNVDLNSVRKWKESVISRLNKGISALAKARNVSVITGIAKFQSNSEIKISSESEEIDLTFDNCIIATGSSPAKVSIFPDDDRIMDSTNALELNDIPKKLLVVGGGYIGLEMGTVYHGLGSKVTVVEFLETLLPGADSDLVNPLQKRLKNQFQAIKLGTKVIDIKTENNFLNVTFESKNKITEEKFDKVLVAVGREPNSINIGLENTSIKVNENGFIKVDSKMRTSIANVYAIGDIIGNPMLAHKATYEGHVAAEVIAELPAKNDAKCIPAVIFTDPEIAWAGLTEAQAKEQNIPYKKGEFPWRASGKAIAHGRTEGLTKTIFNPENKQILGIGIVGQNAGDMISEGCLAIEMGADAEDIGLTIHPHPTLSESIGLSAEAFEGTITDLFIPKKS
ncbi:MAG: dihydrolipoyl dehydrogenase [Candidatus Marinimicrobia bacterium]|nr:dihydrolipoyl dehydrogenase [Candidatus Neomarinimicrobiota bacterium]|tara:strand:+ start:66 stop:1481 length:1416 start_codon:yes stop_codon:yes gene_type:complete